MVNIRQPSVAGSFYPLNKEELLRAIESFLKNTKKIDLKDKPKILIVPHAGIIYSGQTAAWGFKQVENEDYQKIILIGASHYFWFDYAAISSVNFWQTPLGKVSVDRQTAEKLIDKKIIFDDNPHQKEHSLEVELIFLQKVLTDFKIIPILLGEINEELIKNLAEKINQIFDEKTLVVISTDLSHYPPAEIAVKVDDQTIRAILSGKRTEFEKKIKEIESAGYFRLETAICGFQAVRVGLELGEILGIFWKKIFYQNSGEIFGDKQAVVGYGAVIGKSV